MFQMIQHTAISFLCHIKRLIFVMQAGCLLLGTRLILNKIQVKFHLRSFQNIALIIINKCTTEHTTHTIARRILNDVLLHNTTCCHSTLLI